MSYCLNPTCQHPQNSDGANSSCRSCGKKLSPLRDRYYIIRPLGGGGFGRTFVAEDRDKLNELCVVKQLVPQLQGTSAQQKATQLFEQEAKRLQQLGEHPQIPALYAYFEENDYLYLVQQLIVGQSLREQLDFQGAFSEQEIWELLVDLLPVLQFVHAHQVIHRDIKPDNIMRRQSDRRLILIDFGVSKQFATSAIATGTSIGSFGYASSEQMNEGVAYPASDLYSLGVTCFHLLTKISPTHLWTEYGYSWVKQWQQHLNIQISPELTLILDKLLQKDIQQRYQDVEQVLQDLRQIPVFLAADVTQVPPHVPIFTENPQRDRSLQSPIAATTLNPRVSFGWRYKLLLGSAIFLVLGFALYKYWTSQQPATLMGHAGEVNTVAISPDGKKIVSGSDDKTLRIWDLNSQKLLRTLTGHTDWVYALALSADGQTIVSGSKDKTIKLWQLSGQQIRTLTGHTSYINSVAISPDSTKLVSGSYDKTVKVWNLRTGQVDTLKGHSREVLTVAISPDGKKIVSGSVDRTVRIWNLTTLKAQSILTRHTGDVNAIAISPNNQQFVSVSDDRTIELWNLNTGREIRTLTGHLADINAVDFSPDNQHIATGSDDKTVRIWDLTTGEDIYTFKGHQGAVFAVDYSPDGKTLVSAGADKTIRKWQVPN